MKEARSECKTRLLTDSPADEDAFGSHDRVAASIEEMFRSEPGGKAVALIGPLGAGKSTVIRLLQNRLGSREAEGKDRLFVFDAWAHQGDPLRRSFLESLVGFLTDSGWTEESKWNEDLEALSRRKEDSETTTEPFLTKPGRLIAASAFLVPLGLAVLRQTKEHIGPVPVSTVGLVLSVLPLLLGLCTWVFWRPTWRIWSKEFWTANREPHAGESVFNLFIQKTVEKHTSRTTRIPDPTSLEFSDFFSRILTEVLSENRRRLVVVMDNLDRADPQEALAIWATMRTFFEPSGRPPEWLDRFWLLVPFDPTALGRLWRDDDALPEAFIAKTFQARFRVPPPVLSDWKSFLIANLKEAFPMHERLEDFDAIYRLFRLKGIPTDRPITPREIKLFINNVGSLHRQWQDNIPLSVQALYVLLGRDLGGRGENLLSAALIDERTQALVGSPDWQRYVAALHFNVPTNKALQVLLKDRVERAFQAGEPDDLHELETVEGFVDVCEQVIEERAAEWAAEEPFAVTGAANVVQQLGTDPAQWSHSWRILRGSLSVVEKWPKLTDRIGQGVVSILEHTRADEFSGVAKKVLGSLSKSPPESADQKPGTDEDIVEWVRAATRILSVIQGGLDDESLARNFRVPGTAATYLRVLVALTNADLMATTTYFVPAAKQVDVISELSNACAEGRFREEHADAMLSMREVEANWTWDPLVDQLVSRLQPSNSLDAPEIRGCIKGLLVLGLVEGHKAAAENLPPLATQGTLFHHLAQTLGQSDDVAAALCLIPILRFIPDGNVQANVGASPTGVDFYNKLNSAPNKHEGVVTALVDSWKTFGRPEDLISLRRSAENTSPLVDAILERWAQGPEAIEVFSPDILLESFDDTYQALSNESLTKVVRELAEKRALSDFISQKPFDSQKERSTR